MRAAISLFRRGHSDNKEYYDGNHNQAGVDWAVESEAGRKSHPIELKADG